jgi:hypothetical protein
MQTALYTNHGGRGNDCLGILLSDRSKSRYNAYLSSAALRTIENVSAGPALAASRIAQKKRRSVK